MNGSGSLVTDGSYSIEFKLYTAVSGGVNEWTETQSVAVKNGYFSAYLGNVTPFPGSIDWSQEKWLTMNVNADGEMTPRIKLTAVPYAFRAGQADTLTITGGSVTGDNLLQKAPGSVQSLSSANAGLRINQTGSGGLLQLQGNGSDVLTVDKLGNLAIDGTAQIGAGSALEQLTVGGAINLGNTSNSNAGTIRWTGTDFEGFDGASWLSLTDDYTGTPTININKVNQEQQTADNTLQPDDDLTFAIGANETWTYKFVIQATSPTAADIQFSVTAPSGATCVSAVNNVEDGVGIANLACGVSSGVLTTLNTPDLFEVSGTVVNGSTAGSVTLNWAQFGASGTTTVHAGSYMVAQRISGTISGLEFMAGGNSFGTVAELGTNDNFGLDIQTNGTTRLAIADSGEITFVTEATATNGLVVSGGDLNLSGTESILNLGTNITGNAALTIGSGGAGDLVFDSASGVVVLSDSILRRQAAGATWLQLNDAGDTTLSVINTDGSGVANLSVEGEVSATSFAGSGAGLTSLNAGNISSGSLSDSRLSANVALLNANQTFTGRPTFSDGLILGTSTSTSAGALRWSGTDFEGYDGIQWVSLTTGGSGSGPLSVSLIQVYDGAGGTDLNTGTPAALPWNTETKKDTGYTHSNVTNNSRVYMDAVGWYKVSYSISGSNQTAAATNVLCQVRLNGSTYNQPSASYSYTNDTTDRYSTNTASVFLQTTGANEYYEVLCSQAGSSGSNLAVASQSWTSAEMVTEPIGGSGMAFEQDGNAFTETGILGTTDNFGLTFITNNAAALALSNTGDATFSGMAYLSGGAAIGNAAGDSFTISSSAVALPNGLNFDSNTLVLDAASNFVGINTATPNNKLSINQPTTNDALAQALVSTGGTGNKALVLQRLSGQTANIFEAQDESGQVLSFINQDGRLGLGRGSGLDGSLVFHNASNNNTATLVTGLSTAGRTIVLPDENGTICLANSNNCGFVKFGAASAQVDSGTGSSIFINKTGASGNILTLQKNGAGVLTILNSGAVEVASQTKISANSAVALEVRNSSGATSFFAVNTTGSLVQVGSATPDGTSILLVLDSGTSDPGGVNGGSYYNSTYNKNRCFEGGAWTDCATTVVVGETTLGTANATISVTLNRNVEYLRCRVDIKGRSGSAIPWLRFNNDTGVAAYGWNLYGIIAAATIDAQDASDSELQLASAGSTAPFSANVDITNFGDTRKAVEWTSVGAEAIGSNMTRISGGGTWSNTSTQVTSVQFVASTGTFNSGSHAWCEGRNIR